MARGRRPKGPELAGDVDASELARRKLRVILETISGGKTVPEACEELGIKEARFHQMRSEWLVHAAEILEPRAPGRPPKQSPKTPETTAMEKELARLRYENERLKLDAVAAQIRLELGIALPHLVRPHKGAEKKTTGSIITTPKAPRRT